MRLSLATAMVVFRKELVDALRDRRTLLVVLLSGVLMGPLVLVALSSLVGDLEARAERRLLLIDGWQHAPTLVNFLQRQGFRTEAPPVDYETGVRAGRLGDPVLVVGESFEAALAQGEVRVELVSDSSNRKAEAASARVQQLLAGFNRERGSLALALRGVSPQLLEPVRLDSRDLASAPSRASQLSSMLPFFVILAVLYGALNAALDTTAGERERACLEPLLASPARGADLVGGKWLAVCVVATAVAICSCLSFIPAQWLLRSATLQAVFRYGWAEAAGFVAVLLPLVAGLAALLMAVAVRCRSFKEAQANTTVVTLAVSLLPLSALFSQGGEARWHFWVPALAQSTLMTRILKGEALGFERWAPALAVCALLTAVGLTFVVRSLRGAATQ